MTKKIFVFAFLFLFVSIFFTSEVFSFEIPDEIQKMIERQRELDALKQLQIDKSYIVGVAYGKNISRFELRELEKIHFVFSRLEITTTKNEIVLNKKNQTKINNYLEKLVYYNNIYHAWQANIIEKEQFKIAIQCYDNKEKLAFLEKSRDHNFLLYIGMKNLNSINERENAKLKKDNKVLAMKLHTTSSEKCFGKNNIEAEKNKSLQSRVVKYTDKISKSKIDNIDYYTNRQNEDSLYLGKDSYSKRIQKFTYIEKGNKTTFYTNAVNPNNSYFFFMRN